MIGITSYGTYIPRLRLDRMAIFQSMGWFAPAIMMVAQGERSMCNWDEDSITMAVTAARDCLIGQDKSKIDALYLASTTLPFADRQNAGIISTALNLRDDIVTTDFTASQRVGTTALVTAFDAIKGGERNNILVTAADKRETKAAYFYEMWFGDGAAALMVGDKDVIAEYKGSYSLSYDFAEHYRGRLNEYDYVWEERWARDEGYSKIIPEAINGLLDQTKTNINDIDHLVYPCFFKAEHRKIAKKVGAKPEQVMDNLHEMCGETGCAHPLVMLTSALEKASPGQRILVAGFGQGCNALLFEVTDNITKLESRSGFEGAEKNKKSIDNYPKFLKFRDLIKTEMGIRAEAPTQIPMTTLWRKRKMIHGLVGGKCKECETPQYPKMDICVNPNCNSHHSQEDYEFSNIPAKINSFTGDLLAVSIDPPHKYGMIQFEGGGRFMADFTDCDLEELKVGLQMQMVFRRRVHDKERGLSAYFWKATPVPGAAELMNQVRYDDQVAIITGAGGGLGRTYALEMAKRGAKIVVNDLGGSRDGSGDGSTSAADIVVNEIKDLGGEAVANYDNVATVEGGENIVKTAIDNFGRVDIVVNNAGILRDKSFTKMEPENWKAVMDVHLNGAYHVSRPAFTLMKEQGYGRIIMTTSAAGLYGNFGQTNYSAAKLALVGLMNTLKIEGAKYNIKVNTIAPLAASRLTEDIMPPDLFAKMKPEFVAPMVMYLASDKCEESGGIFNAGMGYFNRAEFLTGPGTAVGKGTEPPSPEDIKANWDAINSMDGAKPIGDANAAIMALISPPDPNEKSQASETEQQEDTVTPKDIFEKMPSQFKKDAAAGVDVVFQYLISGDKGGDWVVTIKDQNCDVQAGTADKATCILKMGDVDFVDMITGKLKPMQAFTSGKLNISGDVMKSQLIEKLFSIK